MQRHWRGKTFDNAIIAIPVLIGWAQPTRFEGLHLKQLDAWMGLGFFLGISQIRKEKKRHELKKKKNHVEISRQTRYDWYVKVTLGATQNCLYFGRQRFRFRTARCTTTDGVKRDTSIFFQKFFGQDQMLHNESLLKPLKCCCSSGFRVFVFEQCAIGAKSINIVNTLCSPQN